MGLIAKELDNLKDSDILSFILFALFKLRETSEYSGISELAYILDKDNLFKLCEYFGGLTITIPTVEELEELLNALLLYKYTDIDKLDFDESINSIKQNINKRNVKKCYIKIRELLSDYVISSRGKI